MSKSAGNVVAPQDVIKQSGAEILRLWVAAQDYREDIRISQEILNHLIEAYRKIRNTCRFLLSNLYDFDAAQHRVPYGQLPELDRWALTRLGGLVNRIRLDYKEFGFHAVFHELNNFCSVDMSAVYLDILKDRLYTFRKEDHSRRSSQTVMLEILVAMTKLMAPILSFTAEEIWRMLPKSARGDQQVFSVHLAAFPELDPQWIDPQLEQNWNDFLLHIRSLVLGKLEEKIRDRIIGSSLEAKVILYAQRASPAQYDFLKPYEGLLQALFIVSQVELIGVDHLPLKADNRHDLAEGLRIEVIKAVGNKCERCWNYRPAVGTFKDHPTLCDRCVEAVK
jgi:isoleucyl-tRNA synthetase